jgi:hypothetical protein
MEPKKLVSMLVAGTTGRISKSLRTVMAERQYSEASRTKASAEPVTGNAIVEVR